MDWVWPGALDMLGAFAAGVLDFARPRTIGVMAVFWLYAGVWAVRGEARIHWLADMVPLPVPAMAIGFGVLFVLLGLPTTLPGRFVWYYQSEFRWLGSGLLVLSALYAAGLKMGGVVFEGLLFNEHRTRAGWFGAAVIGAGLGAGFHPEASRMLTTIVIYGATLGNSGTGSILMVLYAFGLVTMLVISTLAVHHLMDMIPHGTPAGRWVVRLGSWALAAWGGLLILDRLSDAGPWMIGWLS